MTDATLIARALWPLVKAACPSADGLRLGRRDDKSTWLVTFPLGMDVSDAERAAGVGVIDAFDPSAIKPDHYVDFETALQRLTDDEWAALKAACDSSVPLARMYERAKTRGKINLNDQEVISALADVVRAGLFTQKRLDELFAD